MDASVFLKIPNLLAAPEISRLVALSRELRFVDGRVSNPANQTKVNLQADAADPKYAESVQIVSAAFTRSREFVDFALPKHVAPPLLCRYESGMKYGAHADAAVIQLGAGRIRSDLSCTVFVSDPSTYTGGELVIAMGNLAIPIKSAAGEAIVYPSTALHEVVPVRSGQRLVSITFIESLIADQHQRTQVYELNEIAALEGLTMKWENRVRLDVVRQNLLRMWSTT
ncbi:MAG: Fe2+-dependent dioxygenase [Betaproteobacteria bacterium]|nr:MAG: Fe2+-dependent dioxygenase [Betaproteobacteria bacterium]